MDKIKKQIIKTKSLNQQAIELYNQSAIIVNLYYTEYVEEFFDYLKDIPDEIDIYIKSSLDKIIDMFKDFEQNKLCNRTFIYIKKENRGRDISALLVDGQNIWRKYEYICFIHDKKAKRKQDESVTALWRINFLENMIGNNEYIDAVLNMFKVDTKLGLMIPPYPYDKNWNRSYMGNNYDNMVKLAMKIGILNNIEYDENKISIGTSFWCRTKSLKKLWEVDWKYEDFDNEPLPVDGTISHAIERILPYVADDAGYKTVIAVNQNYIDMYCNELERDVHNFFDEMSYQFPVHSFDDIKKLMCNLQEISKYFKIHRNVYFYGAGFYGKKLYEFVKSFGLQPSGFIVTKKEKDICEINGIKVLELNELDKNQVDGIVITVGNKFSKDIEQNLQNKDINDYLMINI